MNTAAENRIVELETKLASLMSTSIISLEMLRSQFLKMIKERDELKNLLSTVFPMLTDYLELSNFYRSISAVSEIEEARKQILKAINGEKTHPRATASSHSD